MTREVTMICDACSRVIDGASAALAETLLGPSASDVVDFCDWCVDDVREFLREKRIDRAMSDGKVRGPIERRREFVDVPDALLSAAALEEKRARVAAPFRAALARDEATVNRASDAKPKDPGLSPEMQAVIADIKGELKDASEEERARKKVPRCDECDPSFTCFDSNTACRKGAPLNFEAMTPPLEQSHREPRETQQSISAWAEATFGPATSNMSCAARANVEMAELVTALAADDKNPKARIECADIVIVLYRLCECNGWDLHAAIDEKMATNRNRKWTSDGNGHGQHVEEELDFDAVILALGDEEPDAPVFKPGKPIKPIEMKEPDIAQVATGPEPKSLSDEEVALWARGYVDRDFDPGWPR